MTEEIKAEVSPEDAKKLEEMKSIPTLGDEIFSMSTEGRTLFDVVAMFMGGETREILSILERTNLSRQDVGDVAELLTVAKYGLDVDGSLHEKPITEVGWAIPKLRDMVIFILRGRVSLDGKSREQAVEALRQIKMRLEQQQKPMNTV